MLLVFSWFDNLVIFLLCVKFKLKLCLHMFELGRNQNGTNGPGPVRFLKAIGPDPDPNFVEHVLSSGTWFSNKLD